MKAFLGWLESVARKGVRRLRRECVELGVSPERFGWRYVEAASLTKDAVSYRTVHAPAHAANALPGNFAARQALPDDPHWWGYSMRDVPSRMSGETFIATFRDATVLAYRDSMGEFHPGILSHDDRAINLREIRFRQPHGEVLNAAKAEGTAPVRLNRAVWVLERVYENHSHWLTAHLPKLLLAKELGLLDKALLPLRLEPAQEVSLRRAGIEPEGIPRYDETRPLVVSELTVIGSDRFRPELLRPVRDAMAPALPKAERNRRIYISRARARFRRLLNEDEIWPMLEARGFERTFMEDLSFEEQVELMRRTEFLVAPHGAGLTNMMFCAEGTKVVEIASPYFPNPNFYALSQAMGHSYYLVPAEDHGDDPPLERDMSVPFQGLREVLDMIEDRMGYA